MKERRRLVLLLRETPLTAGHLRNMLTLTESGGIVAPPVPAFYTRPKTLDDIVDHTVGRALDLFGIDTGIFPVGRITFTLPIASHLFSKRWELSISWRIMVGRIINGEDTIPNSEDKTSGS